MLYAPITFILIAYLFVVGNERMGIGAADGLDDAGKPVWRGI
jgi:hypothetical protein